MTLIKIININFHKIPLLAGSIALLLVNTGCKNKTPETRKVYVDSAVRLVPPAPVSNAPKIQYNILKNEFNIASQHLKGNVATVTTSDYAFTKVNGDLVKKLLERHAEHYNEKGLLTERFKYGPDSDLQEKWTYVYDENDKLQERDCYNARGKIKFRYTTLYDIKGNEVETTCYDSMGLNISKMMTSYDAAGQIIATHIKLNGLSNNFITYSYRDNGHTFESLLFANTGMPEKKYITKFNDKGLQYITFGCKPDGTIDQIDSIQYDTKGNAIEYDDVNLDGTIYKKTICYYDDHNNLIESLKYRPDGKIDPTSSYTFSNEYDNAGNMIKTMKSVMTKDVPQPIGITESEITYR